MGYGGGYQVHSQAKERPWMVHPIWRGFGCVMLLIIPVMAYAAASLLIDLNFEQQWGIPVPREMYRTIPIDIPSPVAEIPGIYWEVPHLYGNLLLGAVLMLIGFGLLMIFYTLIYSLMGPPRRGPLDAEPVRSTPRKKQKDWRKQERTFRR
jgi:hypothetical protein